MKEAFVGFDSAWSEKNKGAICYAIYQEGARPEMSLPQPASFKDARAIIKKLQKECDDILVAVDQPIIVPNLSDSRPVDGVARSLMAHLGSAAQSANRLRDKKRTFGDDAPIWEFISNVGSCKYSGMTGRSVCDGIVHYEDARTSTGRTHTHVIEVYPALALPALESRFMERRHGGRRWAARYNPCRDTFCLGDWNLVCKTVRRHANKFELHQLSKWVEALKSTSKRDQNMVDAAICLLVALQWRRQSDGVCAIGDIQSGYIVTPTSESTRKILQATCDRFGVCFNVGEEYDRPLGFEGSHVPTFGELLLEIPQDDQEFQRLPISDRLLNL